jgi:hypothetical protein
MSRIPDLKLHQMRQPFLLFGVHFGPLEQLLAEIAGKKPGKLQMTSIPLPGRPKPFRRKPPSSTGLFFCAAKKHLTMKSSAPSGRGRFRPFSLDADACHLEPYDRPGNYLSYLYNDIFGGGEPSAQAQPSLIVKRASARGSAPKPKTMRTEIRYGAHGRLSKAALSQELIGNLLRYLVRSTPQQDRGSRLITIAQRLYSRKRATDIAAKPLRCEGNSRRRTEQRSQCRSHIARAITLSRRLLDRGTS